MVKLNSKIKSVSFLCLMVVMGGGYCIDVSDWHAVDDLHMRIFGTHAKNPKGNWSITSGEIPSGRTYSFDYTLDSKFFDKILKVLVPVDRTPLARAREDLTCEAFIKLVGDKADIRNGNITHNPHLDWVGCYKAKLEYKNYVIQEKANARTNANDKAYTQQQQKPNADRTKKPKKRVKTVAVTPNEIENASKKDLSKWKLDQDLPYNDGAKAKDIVKFCPKVGDCAYSKLCEDTRKNIEADAEKYSCKSDKEWAVVNVTFQYLYDRFVLEKEETEK